MSHPSDTGTTPRDKPVEQNAATNSRQELVRENELVESTGTIPKRVMAVAFGLVFILAGLGVLAMTDTWIAASLLTVLGVLCIGWAIYATIRPPRRSAN